MWLFVWFVFYYSYRYSLFFPSLSEVTCFYRYFLCVSIFSLFLAVCCMSSFYAFFFLLILLLSSNFGFCRLVFFILRLGCGTFIPLTFNIDPFLRRVSNQSFPISFSENHFIFIFLKIDTIQFRQQQSHPTFINHFETPLCKVFEANLLHFCKRSKTFKILISEKQCSKSR